MAKALAAVDLRGSTEEDLDHRLAEAKIELFNLRFQAATGQLESHGRLRAVRKEIARIYTVKRERELGIVTLEEDELAEDTVPAQDTAPAKENEPAEDSVAEEEDADE
jgi:large subunit ribosomal protein L29